MILPTVDFKNLSKDFSFSSLNEEEENDFCEFKNFLLKTGSFVIKNHGISNYLFDDMLKESRMFFQLPYPTKKAYVKSGDKVNAYSGYYVSQRQKFRERYDMTFDTKYPEEVPNFEKIFINYKEQCNTMIKHLLILIAKAIDLEDISFFVRQHSAILDGLPNTKSHLSTIYYKSTSHKYLMDKHTDISTFTLVFASSPGLQIYCNDEWVNVDCGHNDIVFHIGDLLQRWTGGLCSATVHRVTNFNNTDDDRISIPYFVHPNCNAVVQPLFNHCEYGSVIAEDYWKSKFN